MLKRTLLSIVTCSLIMACGNPTKPKSIITSPVEFENKGQQIIADVIKKVGDHNSLIEKKDVSYTYTYQTPDGKKDISEEQYIFQGELSKGTYHTHERTFPELTGIIIQGYDGKEFWLKHNDQLLTDEKYLKKVKFNRPTNYYWFTMLQKLMDPGLNYEYIGETNTGKTEFDIVKITFESASNKPTDIYQLYVNRESKLIDKFLFTVADFGIMETPFLMKLEYENIEGILIPRTRKYKKSTWQADESDEDWIAVNWSNIKFNNGLTPIDFKG